MLKKSFKINSEIYNEEIILDSISDFKDVSQIAYKNGEISISGETEEEILEVFNELMNYVIGLHNS